MKLGVAISMYDEHEIVQGSVRNIKEHYPDADVSVVHSDDGATDVEYIKKECLYIKLSDLSTQYNRFEYPSRAVCRNFGAAFSMLYNVAAVASEFISPYDLIVGMTGDTKVTDASNFQRVYDKMKSEGKFAMVSQAIGHDFHADTADPKNDIVGGRYQSEDIHDFACTLFFVDGEFAQKTRVFTDISVTNRFTSEQCFGDELAKNVDYNTVGRLNATNPGYSYHYRDGIVYHAYNGRPGR